MHEGPGISMQKVMTRFKAKSSGGKLDGAAGATGTTKGQGEGQVKVELYVRTAIWGLGGASLCLSLCYI